MTGRRFPLWSGLGAVLVVALLVGSGVFRSAPPTPAQRAAAIESVVRCPTCEDLSVAQSTAPTAVAVRAAVGQLVAEGRSDQQIRAYLVDRYGSSIVLDPPASGWSLTVWLLPLLAGVAAAVALAVVLVRRRMSGGVPGDRDGGQGVPLSPEAAEERRIFLNRSLADADAEYLAGDLSDQDYLALRQRDLVRLTALDAPKPPDRTAGGDPVLPRSSVAVEERVSDAVPGDRPGDHDHRPDAGSVVDTEAGTGPRRRRSWWYLAGAVVAFGAALAMAVTLFATTRQPGQSATGSFAQNPTQQVEETLAQAATDENEGQVGPAARLYQSVLDQHPANEVALAQLGWLEYQTGRRGSSASLIGDARAKLLRAVRLDPGDYAARLYLGTMLLQEDADATGAVAPVPAVPGRRPTAGAGHPGRTGDPRGLPAGRTAGAPGGVGELTLSDHSVSHPDPPWAARAAPS